MRAAAQSTLLSAGHVAPARGTWRVPLSGTLGGHSLAIRPANLAGSARAAMTQQRSSAHAAAAAHFPNLDCASVPGTVPFVE